MTTVLQLSDTHVVRGGDLVSGRLDTNASLDRAVARIAAALPAIGPVDALLLSGDASDDGSAESYARVRAALAPLGLPLYVIPGNHDLRAPMRAAFADDGYLPQDGPLNWAQKIGEITLIGLDTLVEGQGAGRLDAGTLDFLDGALKEAGDRPVLLALHHPPFASGIAFMDRIGLDGIAPFARILAAHGGEIRVVCGHIHSTMIASVGGHVALSAPSPCSSFAYDRRGDAPVGFHTREDGFLLHRWRGGFQSVHVPLDQGEGPFAF